MHQKNSQKYTHVLLLEANKAKKQTDAQTSTHTYCASHDGGKDKASSQYKGVNSCCDGVETLPVVCRLP